ncbi:Hsp20 family protein [Apilactobacillus apisilvae]|uniref:Hsp20 family protein n=1 Tax=Apilactobacillus apisilvae TaxID=2923364 RepID=A0ABY4PGE8_9LACO|nr:Hsp20 family protein [Apilactobacillus apisilvae]UQS84601.1 Hsp20 family protein [Apilactobacillus apisilvae]
MAYELRNNPFDLFNDFGNVLFNSVASNQVKTDVTESKDNYVVTSELPGFKKNNINIDYNNDNLNIRATHDLKNENKDMNGRILRKERATDDVSRSLYLPNINTENISASYDGGILKIKLPKQQINNSGEHKIKIA